MSSVQTAVGSGEAGAGHQADHARIAYRNTEVDGVRIFYREAGARDAPTVLLLHGFPSSSHMFRDLIPRLADRFHVVAPDYPGFGNSGCPAPHRFEYTFEHLSQVMERFLVEQALTRFSVYMQDYGGPVGMRIALRHPEWIEALIVQNANLYEAGLRPVVREILAPIWERRTAQTEAPLRKLMEPDGVVFQYRTGARAPERMNPDAWNLDQWGLARPGNLAIQMELHADYHTNVAQYPYWREYLLRHQPPTLVVWGVGDPIFGVEGVHRLQEDLPAAEVHLLDTGHFALEEDADLIASHLRAFLERHVAA